MKVLITGGAGFIGSNAVARAIARGDEVTVVDNLSRDGTSFNLLWLKEQGTFQFKQVDIRVFSSLLDVLQNNQFDAIVHLAGQVAVTTSVTNPREDFEINALGTFNILEAARLTGQEGAIIFSSTNKVYGNLDDMYIEELETRYCFSEDQAVGETQCLDFHSPYGCSKGCADQYIRDYSRIYGLKTVVMRQSCIYGPRQFGIEDQGWVAWFIIAILTGHELTIYGDGKQVRDILYMDDLLDCFDLAVARIDACAGGIFNVGGGRTNSVSLLEFLDLLGELLGKKIEYTFSDWRPGDQKIYLSDISLADQVLGWSPKVAPEEGVKKLLSWVEDNREEIAGVLDKIKGKSRVESTDYGIRFRPEGP